jgi:hypothetical protein
VVSASGVYTDERGTLVSAEFADLPFTVRRVFTVRGPRAGAVRGDHVVDGDQLLVLVSGMITLYNGADADNLGSGIELTEPGTRILLPGGSYVRYEMPDDAASILVLCERPFVARR